MVTVWVTVTVSVSVIGGFSMDFSQDSPVECPMDCPPDIPPDSKHGAGIISRSGLCATIFRVVVPAGKSCVPVHRRRSLIHRQASFSGAYASGPLLRRTVDRSGAGTHLLGLCTWLCQPLSLSVSLVSPPLVIASKIAGKRREMVPMVFPVFLYYLNCKTPPAAFPGYSEAMCSSH